MKSWWAKREKKEVKGKKSKHKREKKGSGKLLLY